MYWKAQRTRDAVAEAQVLLKALPATSDGRRRLSDHRGCEVDLAKAAGERDRDGASGSWVRPQRHEALRFPVHFGEALADDRRLGSSA